MENSNNAKHLGNIFSEADFEKVYLECKNKLLGELESFEEFKLLKSSESVKKIDEPRTRDLELASIENNLKTLTDIRQKMLEIDSIKKSDKDLVSLYSVI